MTHSHLFKTLAGWELHAAVGGSLILSKVIGTYKSKAEAKRIAIQMGLAPWNY
jgi:hypothetical protein